MEEWARYFRDALYRPATVPAWDEWWGRNETSLREGLPKVEYLRLKRGGLAAAEEYLRRTGQLEDPVRLDEAFLRDVGDIEWFSRCGQPLSLPAGVSLARSPAEARDALAAPGTAALREAPPIQLYNYVAATDYAFFSRWNDRAWALNAWIDAAGWESVWEERLAAVGLGAEFLPAVRSDVLFGCIAHECREVPGCPEGTARLLTWYRQGRLVCGWQGEWPAGELVIY